MDQNSKLHKVDSGQDTGLPDPISERGDRWAQVEMLHKYLDASHTCQNAKNVFLVQLFWHKIQQFFCKLYIFHSEKHEGSFFMQVHIVFIANYNLFLEIVLKSLIFQFWSKLQQKIPTFWQCWFWFFNFSFSDLHPHWQTRIHVKLPLLLFWKWGLSRLYLVRF